MEKATKKVLWLLGNDQVFYPTLDEIQKITDYFGPETKIVCFYPGITRDCVDGRDVQATQRMNSYLDIQDQQNAEVIMPRFAVGEALKRGIKPLVIDIKPDENGTYLVGSRHFLFRGYQRVVGIEDATLKCESIEH